MHFRAGSRTRGRNSMRVVFVAQSAPSFLAGRLAACLQDTPAERDGNDNRWRQTNHRRGKTGP